MANDPKRIQLFKALLRFGGDPDNPPSVEAAVMPNTPMEKGVGYQLVPVDTTEDPEESNFYQTQKRKKLKRIGR